jgi:hypothetical protein
MADIALIVISDNTSSERRITPSWTLAQLKTRLEPITGVPASAQQLSLKDATGSGSILLTASNEEATQVASFPLAPYAELRVGKISYCPMKLALSAFDARECAPQVVGLWRDTTFPYYGGLEMA